MSQLNVIFALRSSEIRFSVEGAKIEMPTLICLCFQALAEALKINKSITNINLQYNQIGDEGFKAWCVAGPSH